MKLTIDRFEGGFAVCEKEDRTALYVSRRELPIDAKGGDVFIVGDDNTEIETAKTAQRNWQ
jgi:hypothetical protein